MHIIMAFNLIFDALYLCFLFYELYLLRVNTLKINKTGDTFLTTELKKSNYCIFVITMCFLFFIFTTFCYILTILYITYFKLIYYF